MTNNDNNEFEDLDKLFQSHKDSLPEFEQSDYRDKVMLDAIFAKSDEIRKKAMKEKKSKQGIFIRVRYFWDEINFLSPKYAISAGLLISGLTLFFIFNSSEQPQTKSFSIKTELDTTQNHSNFAQKTDTITETNTDGDLLTTDLGSISYDYSVRGNTSTNDSINLESRVIELIVLAMKEYKVSPKINNNIVESSMYLDKSSITQIQVVVKPKSKKVTFKIIQKNNSSKDSFPRINSQELKNSIEDKIYLKLSN